MAAQSILVVEDEVKIAHLLRDYLERAGYRVALLDRGDQVAAWVRRFPPDMILLDIMLPFLDGMEVCRMIRHFSQVPIIMITARVEEMDRLLGLELGADDYICKPFSPREVVARIKAVLRRTQPRQSSRIITAGAIAVDEEKRLATINGRELKLTPTEFGLLRLLASNPDRVFTRSELVNRVQGYDFEGYERIVDTHVKNLRKKVAALLPEQEIISAVYGVGYKLSTAQ